MLYFLICLVLVAAGFSALGLLAYSALDILAGAAYLCLACYVSNQAFARLFRVQANVESQFITALILALIVGPVPFPRNLAPLTLISLLAMASKYALAYRGRHLFNPAAVAVALAALLGVDGASWWVSGWLLLPFVLLGGLLVARKTRRFHLVLAFLLAYFVLLLGTQALRGAPLGQLPLLLRRQRYPRHWPSSPS
jgi:Na+-transporting NADH:ubiquinone oxidoreductase subunit NqrB